MMDDAIVEAAQRWCAAVSADAFCGEPSRYEDSYEQLLSEIGKVESLHADSLPDWDVVYRCADALLRENTKDMTVLGALCIALFEREGFRGLASGLEAYRWLIEHHSKDMFPSAKRRRGRAGAYTWLTRQLEARLEGAEPNGTEATAYAATFEAFNGLDGLLRDELADQHPAVRSVRRALEFLRDQAQQAAAPAPEPEPEPQPEPVAAAPAASAAPA
ncbi:MAG: type VI secretion system ImpA family N-terminal domain-containing protein, partial [Myxococcales bacterium]|nr:type VI secretion system ImpA family N-terminal domain-containing protein [Myxococcales bacterium]